ncbi:MAG: WXG100 family type VII secretion target [Labedaea sp.]
MSAAGDLARYAGGDLVTAQASKVDNADPGAVAAAAARLSTAATNASANAGAVGKAVRGLDAAWEGTSADQFVAYMDRFGKAGTDVGGAMTQAAGALNKVAEASPAPRAMSRPAATRRSPRSTPGSATTRTPTRPSSTGTPGKSAARPPGTSASTSTAPRPC